VPISFCGQWCWLNVQNNVKQTERLYRCCRLQITMSILPVHTKTAPRSVQQLLQDTRSWATDRQTDRPRYIGNNEPHLMLCIKRCGLKSCCLIRINIRLLSSLSRIKGHFWHDIWYENVTTSPQQITSCYGKDSDWPQRCYCTHRLILVLSLSFAYRCFHA